MTRGDWGKIKAYFNIVTEEGFIIKGLKLIDGINGKFVGFPSKKNDAGEYKDTVFASKELRVKLTQFAIKEYGSDTSSNFGNGGNVPNDFNNQMPAPQTAPAPAQAYDDDIPF